MKNSLRDKNKTLIDYRNKFLGFFAIVFAVLAIPSALYLVQQNSDFRSKAAGTIIDDTPVSKSILLLIFNPVIEQSGSVKLTTLQKWSDPDNLTNEGIVKLKASSHDYLSYYIKERIEVDGYPVKSDGFQYTDDSYLNCWNNHSTCHSPDIIDYQRLFSTYNICGKGVDEVWIWGGPWFGYWEYHPVNYCGKTQFVMGFNYERGIGEFMHDFGHRMEFVLINRVNNGVNWAQDEATEWNKFSKISNHCGNIHYVPGGPGEYIYNSQTSASSDCDGYLTYPTGPFTVKSVNCTAWGCTHEGYVSWWLSHVPSLPGTRIDPTTGRILYNNWWKYYAFYDETAFGIPTPTPTSKPTPTVNPNPSPTPIPQSSSTVSSIYMTHAISGKNVSLSTVVTIKDEKTSSGLGTANVSLKITSPSGRVSSFTKLTDASGKATFTIKSKEKGVFRATVTNVTKTGYTYHPTVTEQSLTVN